MKIFIINLSSTGNRKVLLLPLQIKWLTVRFRALFVLYALFCVTGCVQLGQKAHGYKRYRAYQEEFHPVKFMGKDYWDCMRDSMIQGYKEGGSTFHFDPDEDILVKESAIQILNMARYTHVPSYKKYLLETPDKAIIIRGGTLDLSTSRYRTRYFANSPISDLQVSSARDFFASKDWQALENKIGKRIFGYTYPEASWQVRHMNRKELKKKSVRNKHIGISKYNLKIPETVADYYNYYCELFKTLQKSTGAGNKLIPVVQFDHGFFLPVKLGAPAASYYVYANSNYSRRMAFARGAARQYGVPIVVYFSQFVTSNIRLDGRFEMDIPYTLLPYLYWSKDVLEKLAMEKPVDAKGWLCTLSNFKVSGEKFVGVKANKNEFRFEGPLCGMPSLQFSNHLLFQYLSGAGFIDYEGQSWGYYDPTPKQTKTVRKYVNDGEKLVVDGWTDPMNMPVNNSGKIRKDAIPLKEYLSIKRLIDKDIYNTPMTLARAKVIEFSKKHGRGTLYAPIAYVLDPHWALFNRNYFSDEPVENFKSLERMVFNWFRAAFEGAKLSKSGYNYTRGISKASQIDTAVTNYSHRREITDVLTSDAEEDILERYPVVCSVGPLPDSFTPKILEYTRKRGVWSANVSQLPLTEWEKLLNVKFGETMRGHSWKNIVSGKERDESYGYYDFYRLKTSGDGVLLVRDISSGEPLIMKFPYQNGFIVLNLQKAAFIHGKNCGSSWKNEHLAISRAMFSVLESLADDYLPVKVNGNIQSLYNVTENGWTVTLHNIDGISQHLGKTISRDMSAVRDVELVFKQRPHLLEDIVSDKKVDVSRNASGWVAKVKVNPGQMIILNWDEE
jgi:hypothetical protein